MEGNFEATHPLHETFIKSDGFGQDIKVKSGEKIIVPMLEPFAKEALLELSNQDEILELASPTESQKLEAINQVTKAFVKQFGLLFDQWRL